MPLTSPPRPNPLDDENAPATGCGSVEFSAASVFSTIEEFAAAVRSLTRKEPSGDEGVHWILDHPWAREMLGLLSLEEQGDLFLALADSVAHDEELLLAVGKTAMETGLSPAALILDPKFGSQSDRISPLMWAIVRGEFLLADLLEPLSDKDFVSEDGWTAALFQCYNDPLDLARLARLAENAPQPGSQDLLLNLMGCHRTLEAIDAVIGRSDVFAQGDDGESALALLCMHGAPEPAIRRLAVEMTKLDPERARVLFESACEDFLASSRQRFLDGHPTGYADRAYGFDLGCSMGLLDEESQEALWAHAQEIGAEMPRLKAIREAAELNLAVNARSRQKTGARLPDTTADEFSAGSPTRHRAQRL